MSIAQSTYYVFETSLRLPLHTKTSQNRVYVVFTSKSCLVFVLGESIVVLVTVPFFFIFFKSQIYIQRKFKKSLNIYFVVNKILSYAFCIYFLQITHRQKCNLEFLLVLCMKTKLAL